MKRRSRDDIVADILHAVMENTSGATVYRIMSKVHMSFSQAEDYLTVLVRGKLLEYDTTTRSYRITERANRFLELHENLYEMIGIKEVKDTLA